MKIDNRALVNNVNNIEPARINKEAKLPEESQQQTDMKIENQEQMLQLVIEKANKVLEGSERHFEYEVHKPTNQVVISVIDDKTKEVIREIPPKKLLDIIAKLWELAGIIVDKKA
ncbi:flagellar protein FlaG [Carboxydocella sp. JDF658]|uniref:flagellar protein FlaG n=1 Tax=Carboxydocella sp. JDF658 TaxID=1926600 RepID=UPI0009ADC598|nr:flagellar protein FlaG [Carboxydocella sp. JDF658]GAW31870.1 hypothetical protein JDF658_16350 [Carboxydocella sp. JDF658]